MFSFAMVHVLMDGTELLGGTSLLPSRLLSQLALLGVDELLHGVLGPPVEGVLPVEDDDDGHVVIVHRHETLVSDKSARVRNSEQRNTTSICQHASTPRPAETFPKPGGRLCVVFHVN